MGRQLPVVATTEDERKLLSFIETLSPIRVFQSFAPTADDLWVDNWNSAELPGLGYKIWPKSFDWMPKYGETGGPKFPANRRGSFYVANASAAPILEFTSSRLPACRVGRLYWAKDFAAPNGLAYDNQSFSRFVDKVWRWIRKTGSRETNAGSLAPWYLPDAWNSRQQTDSLTLTRQAR